MNDDLKAVPTASKYLSIDEIMAADDIAYCDATAWGGRIRLGSLDAGTMLDFVEGNEDKKKKREAGILLLVQSLVDENGRRIGDKRMIDGFKKKNAKVLNGLVDVILELNGLGREGVDIRPQLRSAGGDPLKLKTLVENLRELADAVEGAGTDEALLTAIGERKKERRAEEKNASSEAS